MGDALRGQTAGIDWPLAYLIITAISIGILVGVWHWLPRSMGRYELIPIGFIVGMYTITSALHYYQVTRDEWAGAVTAIDEW